MRPPRVWPPVWPTDGRPVLLRNATVPTACLADQPPGETASLDVLVDAGRIQRLGPTGSITTNGVVARDLAGGMLFPCFTDAHTHLDKGHIWPRTPNPDGSFAGALASVSADRAAYWRASDVRARMEFGLRCAYAHGTRAIRTHLDSDRAQRDISWSVFAETAAQWRDRITLQAVALVGIDALRDADDAEDLARLVARFGGIMGAVLYPVPDLPMLIDRLVDLAMRYDLALDCHVDENGDATARSLALLAQACLRARFQRPVTVGHCCNLAVQAEDEIDRTLDLVTTAQIGVISLPSCNLYLQDRSAGRTPRWRGVTILHEFHARGIVTIVGGDNCRDPFYAYGDHDMAEVFAQAVKIAHLDHPVGHWPAAVTARPAALMDLADPLLAAGGAADFVLFRARSFSEFLSRAQADRLVVRAGRPIDRTLPDYAELDPVLEMPS